MRRSHLQQQTTGSQALQALLSVLTGTDRRPAYLDERASLDGLEVTDSDWGEWEAVAGPSATPRAGRCAQPESL